MKKIALFLIKLYKKYISPLLPNACRFYPTCSEYTYMAIDRFGFIKGSFLGTKRILKCQPFCKGGIDEVPDKFLFKEQFNLTFWRKSKK